MWEPAFCPPDRDATHTRRNAPTPPAGRASAGKLLRLLEGMQLQLWGDTPSPETRRGGNAASTEHALLWNHKEKFTCSYFEGLSQTETFLYNKETLFSDSRQTLHAFNKSEFLPDAGLWRDGSRRRDRGSSRTQSRRQHVHQLLLLGDGGSNPELLAGVLQHGHGQLSQSAVQHVGPQLVFR